MLFNEPKLLKCRLNERQRRFANSFSALQRAEIAEIVLATDIIDVVDEVSVLFNEPKLLKSGRTRQQSAGVGDCFSALQRAEIAEIREMLRDALKRLRFSALQRAEIAEIDDVENIHAVCRGFSALQRAEIAEIKEEQNEDLPSLEFQCSSTSRNC